jgi:hypothetical protein
MSIKLQLYKHDYSEYSTDVSFITWKVKEITSEQSGVLSRRQILEDT